MNSTFTTVLGMALSLLLLSGCSSTYSAAPRAYSDVVSNVYIGMEKRDFDNVMRPVYDVTREESKRHPEAYQRDGVLHEIVYVRSGWVSDNANTDDEYTPYLFQDGSLVGYGWTQLGGKKTDSVHIKQAEAGATKVKVQQNNNSGGNVFKCASQGGSNKYC